MKNKKIIIALLAVLTFLGLAYLFVGNPVVYLNNKKLQQSITSITNKKVELNEIVPFDWDVVYTFDPYISKAEIEKIVGFKSLSIQENGINEGMVHLLFVKNQKVVASILGYGENLGYRLDFTEKVDYADNEVFNVLDTNGVVMLSQVR